MVKADYRNTLRKMALEKVAFPGGVFVSNLSPEGVDPPPPTVADVCIALDQAMLHDVGTADQRRDAFGRIIETGATVSSPASRVIGAIGGGVLGHFVTKMITDKPFLQGLGAGYGALIGMGGMRQ